MKMKLNKGKNPKKYESKSQKRGKTAIKLIRGGGCDAPDVSTQYINPPGSVMSAGLEGTTNIFQRVFYGPGPSHTNIEVPSCHTSPYQSQIYAPTPTPQHGGQNGGGFFMDMTKIIDKQPAIQGYYDESPPVILDGKTFLSNNCQSQCGGGKISLYKVKKMSQKIVRKVKSKKMSKKACKSASKMTKAQKGGKGGKGKKSKMVKKGKMAKKSKKMMKGKSKSKLVGGGDDAAPVDIGSSESYKIAGQPGNFSPDMMTRDFTCNQLNVTPNCI
jgi:hypothetical protein